MHHCVLEQDEIHSRYKVIVASHSLSEQLVELSPVGDRHVFRLSYAAGEVAVNVGSFEYYAFVDFLNIQ